MAACTVTVNPRVSLGGGKYMYTGTLVHDNTYKTGGQTITQPTTGPVLPEQIEFISITNGTVNHEYIPKAGATAAKVKCYAGAAGTTKILNELESTADLSAITFRFFAVGD